MPVLHARPAPAAATRGGPLGLALQPLLPRLRRVTLLPLEADRAAVVAEAWQAVCDTGAAGVLVPVARGGSGAGLLEAVDTARCLSRYGAALPFLASAVLSTRLAAAAGAEGLLAELCTGDRVGTVARGPGLTWSTSRRTLTGELDEVPHGADADTWLVLLDGADGEPSVVRLDRTACERRGSGDPTRPAVRATLRDVPAELLSVPADAVRQALREGAVVRAAEVLAAAEQALDREDAATARLLQVAWAAVEHAAAVADVDGRLPDLLVEEVAQRAAAVSACVAPAAGGPALRRWWHHRGADGHGAVPA